MSNNRDLHDDHISRLYKMGEQPEPPDHLDAEIKKAARTATPVKRGYLWPSLATAAVLVLSLSLILKVLEQKPLEESILEPISMEGQAIPDAMLQESEEKDEAKLDRQVPKLQRYRTTEQQAIPAPQAPKAEEAASFNVAPAMESKPKSVLKKRQQQEIIGKVASSAAKPLECGHIKLPETNSKQEWIKQYQKAVEQGQLEIARCLKKAYQAKFNQEIPGVSE